MILRPDSSPGENSLGNLANIGIGVDNRGASDDREPTVKILTIGSGDRANAMV